VGLTSVELILHGSDPLQNRSAVELILLWNWSILCGVELTSVESIRSCRGLKQQLAAETLKVWHDLASSTVCLVLLLVCRGYWNLDVDSTSHFCSTACLPARLPAYLLLA